MAVDLWGFSRLRPLNGHDPIQELINQGAVDIDSKHTMTDINFSICGGVVYTNAEIIKEAADAFEAEIEHRFQS